MFYAANDLRIPSIPHHATLEWAWISFRIHKTCWEQQLSTCSPVIQTLTSDSRHFTSFYTVSEALCTFLIFSSFSFLLSYTYTQIKREKTECDCANCNSYTCANVPVNPENETLRWKGKQCFGSTTSNSHIITFL